MLKTLLKASLLAGPLVLTVNHDFYSISKVHTGRVSGGDMSPVLNPMFSQSHSFIEDDYVLVRVLGEDYKPKDIKEKLVRVVEPDHTRVFRRVLCIEGEWCPTLSGYVSVMSGHAWVTNENAEAYAVWTT